MISKPGPIRLLGSDTLSKEAVTKEAGVTELAKLRRT